MQFWYMSDVEISSAEKDSYVSLFGLNIPRKFVPYIKITLVIICAILCWGAYHNAKGQSDNPLLQSLEKITSTNSVDSDAIDKNPQK